jgi:hypothetical protein
MKASAIESLILSDITTTDLQKEMVRCAHIVVEKLYGHLHRKRQLNIVQFLIADERKKKQKISLDGIDDYEVDHVDWFADEEEIDHEDCDDILGIDEW